MQLPTAVVVMKKGRKSTCQNGGFSYTPGFTVFSWNRFKPLSPTELLSSTAFAQCTATFVLRVYLSEAAMKLLQPDVDKLAALGTTVRDKSVAWYSSFFLLYTIQPAAL